MTTKPTVKDFTEILFNSPITPTEKKNETNFLMVYSVLKGLLVPSNVNSKEFHLTIVQLFPL